MPPPVEEAMAKRAAKETSTPLIVALVFFVLTTITFGVMWYMQFSDQVTKDEAVKKANADASAKAGEAADASMKARVYRIFMGIPEAGETGDLETVKKETKGQEKIAAEIKKINENLAKAVGVRSPSDLPSELRIWELDDKGLPRDPKATGLIPVVGDAVNKRDAAIAAATTDRNNYAEEIKKYKSIVAEYENLKKSFKEISDALPKQFADQLNTRIKDFDERTKEYVKKEAASQTELSTLNDEKQRIERERNRLLNENKGLVDQIREISRKIAEKQDAFVYDEPQGKILRRLPDNIVEIDLGSNALVRPGLTFTVLPSDFPEKGRQSRIFRIRVPNERGEYKPVDRFIEKATIEVIEVLGPKLSRARITQEFDSIRDGAAPGDLLYNSVWRKGTADHIALLGIFDVNGDGIDDIESVVRDLTRMGIPVDAYFDMRQRKWVGEITEQTRFIVEGYYPVQSANDPNRDDKTKLLAAMGNAVAYGREKGVQPIKFSDIFPRMGYRMKIDLTPDKINQAAAPYLNRVPTNDMPPPAP
jgi:hypothetical protein